jgi:hypothetical protein
MIKFKKKTTQLITIFSFLQENVATATMVSAATGVPQKSICRFKRDLELKGKLFEVKKAPCKITNCLAWYITTNPELLDENLNVE